MTRDDIIRVCGRVTEQAEPERHFCERCGKRLSQDGVHTCTPPQQAEPVERKPLSEEEIIDATEHIDTSRNGYFIHIARAIERAHGIGGGNG